MVNGMSMTIEEAIKLCEESERINTEHAKNCVSALERNHNLDNAEKCRQMIEWLRELQETRKERDYWKEKAHSYEQTIFKLTDAISKQPEIIYCKDCENWDTTWDSAPNYHYCPIMDGTYSGDFYCAKAERRTDATN